MIEFCAGAIIFFPWFWISLHPGSRLGCAIAPSDLGTAFRQLNQKQLQTPKALRSAGKRSLAFWTGLLAIGVAAGISVGNYTLQDAVTGFPGGMLIGLLL